MHSQSKYLYIKCTFSSPKSKKMFAVHDYMCMFLYYVAFPLFLPGVGGHQEGKNGEGCIIAANNS